jgi:hypothetical protein
MPIRFIFRPTTTIPALLVALAAGRADAQATAAAPKRAAVCARGVTVYSDAKQVPTPWDSVTIPMPAAPVRVTSEAEAEAAEMDLRARAGSVGATGVIMTTETDDDGTGQMRMRRSVRGVYVRADSARAQQACVTK